MPATTSSASGCARSTPRISAPSAPAIGSTASAEPPLVFMPTSCQTLPPLPSHGEARLPRPAASRELQHDRLETFRACDRLEVALVDADESSREPRQPFAAGNHHAFAHEIEPVGALRMLRQDECG